MRLDRSRGPAAYALLKDHSLVVESQAGCLPLVKPWLPLNARAAPVSTKPKAILRVEAARSSDRPDIAGKCTLRLGSIEAYVDDDASTVTLSSAAASWGRLDLEAKVGTLWVDPGDVEQASADVYSMLTIGSALLLGRSQRALIHAGAVVTRGQLGWLVVGDAHSGKSTACASLTMTGWVLLSDDQVVLSRSEGRVSAEGWLRPLHLDEGWSKRVPTGRRRNVHPSELGGITHDGPVELGAVLFTSVRPDEPTSVSRMSAADAFLHIVRQSPWLLADRQAAASIVDTLSSVALLPCHSLHLGLDTFGDAERLGAMLRPLLA